jgi:hypothetical protein
MTRHDWLQQIADLALRASREDERMIEQVLLGLMIALEKDRAHQETIAGLYREMANLVAKAHES